MPSPLSVAFSGHRDCHCRVSDLETVWASYPDAVWVHGGAHGFDSQVDAFAAAHRIPVVVIRPDYTAYPARTAPLVRNRLIVDQADLLVACYDGRRSGGTAYTISYARSQGNPVQILTPCQCGEPDSCRM